MKTNALYILFLLFIGLILPLSGMMSSSSDSAEKNGQKRTFDGAIYLTNSFAQAPVSTISDSLSGSVLKAPEAPEQQAKRAKIKNVSFNDRPQITTYHKEKKAQSVCSSLGARPSGHQYPTILQLLPLILRSVKEDDAESFQKLVDTPHTSVNPRTKEIRIYEKFDVNNLIPNESVQTAATLLELAAAANKIQIARCLIALGAQVNKTGHPKKYSPVVLATINNHLTCVQELLKESTHNTQQIIAALAAAKAAKYTEVYTEFIVYCTQHNIQTTG